MKPLIARRPSPATLIACLALFVALGGVSYGFATGSIDSREIKDNAVRSQDVRRETINTSDLRNNSIRTDDLRNNEVRGRDIRNSTIRGLDVALNTITGLDIREESLGPVPNADTLDGIDSAGFLRADPAPPAPIALQAPSWVATTDPPTFDVDGQGYVRLSGTATKAGSGGVVGVLPAGARPATVKRFAVVKDATAGANTVVPVTVEADGEIRPAPAADTGDSLSLDGVTFFAGG